MLIAQLDIDGFRYDKATQGTPDAIAAMSASFRECARRHGKQNFVSVLHIWNLQS